MKSVRVGDVPVFTDRSDPKAYRVMLMDWIRFQDMADPGSSKRLTLGQQVFVIVSGIQGSARQRLEHVTSLVYAGMTRDEFSDVVDMILDIVDPIDRESSFLETAKAWKELMAKGHGSLQSYDHYWSEYSSLCVRYAYSHGKVSQSPGVQELTALLCVLNANLNKTEFAMTLQAAMQHQISLKSRTDLTSMQKRQGARVTGPRSARDVLSQYSEQPGRTSMSDSVAVQEDDSTPSRSSLEELLAEQQIELSSAKTRADAAQLLLSEVMESLEDIMDSDNFQKIKQARIKIVAEQENVKNCEKLMTRLGEGLKELGSSPKSDANQPAVSRWPTSEQEESYEPIITMESVRIALRRLDFGARALEDTPTAGTEVPTGYASTARTQATIPTKIECFICGGNHKYFQTP